MDAPRCLLLMGLAVLPALFPHEAAAQIQYGGDISWRGNYIWRGLLISSGHVVQPDVFVAYDAESVLGSTGNIFATAGIWTTIETGSQAIGYGRRWFGETNAWVEVSTRRRFLQAAAGAVRYFVQADGAEGPAVNRVDTYELYGRMQFVKSRINPRLSIWYDPAEVNGTYVEAGVTWRIPGWNYVVLPFGSLFLGLDAGYNVGQGRDLSRPDESFYFAEDDAWTHADMSLATTIDAFKFGPVSTAFYVEFHVVYLTAAVLNAPNGRLDGGPLEPWLGVTLSLLAPRCIPGREICG